jgi:RNA polymerase sigma factor (sigma-70 family)
MIESVELKQRLDILHRKHYIWLLQSATNITKNREEAEDLIGDLYIYLADKGNTKIYYADSFNLMYAYRFLKTRWVNKINQNKKFKVTSLAYEFDCEEDVYPIEQDNRIMKAFDEVERELEHLSKTRMWPKAKLFELYYCNDDTMVEVANKIGISKSTTFISIKKIREHLKSIIDNPFKEIKDE